MTCRGKDTLTTRKCIRCRREEQIEEHHIKQRRDGGANGPENKEDRCSACHDYEHARRNLVAAIEHEKGRGQADRIKVCEHRLEVLDRLNSPELIRERGAYLSYWVDTSTHYLPRRIQTREEAEKGSMMQAALSKDIGWRAP
jgi:hypothetical protein